MGDRLRATNATPLTKQQISVLSGLRSGSNDSLHMFGSSALLLGFRLSQLARPPSPIILVWLPSACCSASSRAFFLASLCTCPFSTRGTRLASDKDSFFLGLPLQMHMGVSWVTLFWTSGALSHPGDASFSLKGYPYGSSLPWSGSSFRTMF